MFDLETDNDVTILKMARPKVNAMDLDFLNGFVESLLQIESTKSKAVVIASNCRAFSAGVDLIRLLSEDESYLDRFLPALVRAFDQLFRFPLPTVAAVNGAAVAGGCILASACDYRFIVPDAKIGIPELRVGVPFPSVAFEIMRSITAPHCFQQLVMTGVTFTGNQAVNAGLADQVAPAHQLLNSSTDMARQLLSIPADVYALTKRQLRKPALDRIEQSDAQFAAEIRQLWRRGDIRKEIERYANRTFKKSNPRGATIES